MDVNWYGNNLCCSFYSGTNYFLNRNESSHFFTFKISIAKQNLLNVL